MNTSNYNRENVQERMMSEHEMLITSFTTKLSQKLTMTQQKNRMKITSTNLRQEWLTTPETQQLTLNSLLQEWLHNSSIRKRREIFLTGTQIHCNHEACIPLHQNYRHNHCHNHISSALVCTWWWGNYNLWTYQEKH